MWCYPLSIRYKDTASDSHCSLGCPKWATRKNWASDGIIIIIKMPLRRHYFPFRRTTNRQQFGSQLSILPPSVPLTTYTTHQLMQSGNCSIFAAISTWRRNSFRSTDKRDNSILSMRGNSKEGHLASCAAAFLKNSSPVDSPPRQCHHCVADY